jgi:cytidine deaminase
MTDLFSITEAEKTQLIETAKRALLSAYAPYSQFRVGAAVLTAKGQIFAGCNVENASYGLSICAERNAIATAIMAEKGDTIKLKAIAVVNNQDVPCSPCGACRQVIWEFGKDAVVIFRGSQGWQTSEMIKLLPHGFSC